MLKTASKLYFCAILPFILLAGLAAQQDAQSPLLIPVDDFVQQILSRSGSPATVVVTFQNISGLSQESQEGLQNTILNAFRNSFSFFLLLIVCMGYGVVKPTLGRTMIWVRWLAIAHFVFGLVYAVTSLVITPDQAGEFLPHHLRR